MTRKRKQIAWTSWIYFVEKTRTHQKEQQMRALRKAIKSLFYIQLRQVWHKWRNNMINARYSATEQNLRDIIQSQNFHREKRFFLQAWRNKFHDMIEKKRTVTKVLQISYTFHCKWVWNHWKSYDYEQKLENTRNELTEIGTMAESLFEEKVSLKQTL